MIVYSLEDFLKRAESGGLVCYGVGRRFRVMEQCFKGMGILDKVAFCVDQDESLQGTWTLLDGRKVEIRPVEELAGLKAQGLFLLITNFRYTEIQAELSRQGLLDGIDCFCFTLIYGMLLEDRAMQKSVPENPRLTQVPVIPKIIHYCWFGCAPVPGQYRKWMESWRRFCPDYEIREWTEDNYDITKNTYMYEAYKKQKWGFVSDYARLDIVYEYGGIYLDTDVELVQGLDDMLFQKGFAGFERENFVNFGLGFGAMEKMPMVKELRDLYDDMHFVNKDGSMNLTACPVYQTDFLVNKGLRLNGEYQRVGDFVIYPEKMFCGKSPYTRRVRLAGYTKSIHHYEASWVEEGWKEYNKLIEKDMNS